MRFLVDECTGPAVAHWLREQQHEVCSVYEQARGMDDDDVIRWAYDENWILITNDKDFGEKVYRERRPHRGVVLLRLEDERTQIKIDTIRRLLRDYADQLADYFIVVTETRVRVARVQQWDQESHLK
jgi:predicted nuclease of predicted toxin-antitoxin system